jgi:hypothetical protein
MSNDPYEDPTLGATIRERPDEDPTAAREVGEALLRTRSRETRWSSGRMKGGVG